MYNDNQISNEIKQKFEDWWHQKNTGRPLMHICVKKSEDIKSHKEFFLSPEDYFTGASNIVKYYKYYMENYKFYAEGFMDFKVNLGPGSLALYVGAEPSFSWDTLWYKEISEEDWEKLLEQKFEIDSFWIEKHIKLIEDIKALTNDEFFIPMPDIVESIDTMAALRGAQELCYDLIDEEEKMKEYIEKFDDYYLKVYKKFYDVVSEKTGGTGYAGFKVWGEGKTAKMQCDFCALMNPYQFEEFVMPSMRKECEFFDRPFYHLDGVDAIRHLDNLLTIENLRAIQWTHGVCKPDGLSEDWYEPIYDKVIAAGKSLYLLVDERDAKSSIDGIKKLIDRYGTSSLFFRFLDPMTEETALQILTEIDKYCITSEK